MNLANLIPVWLKRFLVQRVLTKDDFDFFSLKPVEQPVTESPAPELSCLAKGIIKSIQEHPEEWPQTEGVSKWTDRTHTTTGMKIACGYGYYVDGERLCDPDSGALLDAVDNLVNGPTRKAAAERRAIFEKLGCPDPEVSTDSSKAQS